MSLKLSFHSYISIFSQERDIRSAPFTGFRKTLWCKEETLPKEMELEVIQFMDQPLRMKILRQLTVFSRESDSRIANVHLFVSQSVSLLQKSLSLSESLLSTIEPINHIEN